jgi:hypothetical protein
MRPATFAEILTGSIAILLSGSWAAFRMLTWLKRKIGNVR